MEHELIIRPEARTDLLDTYHWHQEQRLGLGHIILNYVLTKFFQSFENAPSFIRKYIMMLGAQLLKDSRLVCFT